MKTGDERPCHRCIKRGLQDACRDGVRKKAKYLHDAPDNALLPGAANFYNQESMRRSRSPSFSQGRGDAAKPGANNQFYPPSTSSSYSPFDNQNQNKMSPQMINPTALASTQTPMSPTFAMTTGANTMPSDAPSSSSAAGQNSFGAFFDPSDPALFNFDLASMNFGNRYGAMEFGMLGHMATGAGETPPSDNGMHRGSVGQRSNSQYSSTGTYDDRSQSGLIFNDPLLNEWSSNGQNVNMGMYGQQGNMQHLLKQDVPPHAFSIGSNFASPPSTTTSPVATTTAANEDTMVPKPVISTPHLRRQSLVSTKRRQRNPSSVYESVTEPYSYTAGFHKLTAYIHRRFSKENKLRIAKALASIRPSFIATAKTLTREDLIFMEKCFQRTLWEYEDFINACGTPTIVCRRSGEVAAVGKEFSILTGWRKEVLLGKEPNLNVNTGQLAALSDPNSRGNIQISDPPGTPAPVFLAELLDDESVMEFYEDFARLAFGDSRGSVMNTCKLLKYKTKEDVEAMQSASSDDGRWQAHVGKGGIASEAGMNRLGFRDGRVECSYCWTVKRDVFDIPMLIVMNVSFSSHCSSIELTQGLVSSAYMMGFKKKKKKNKKCFQLAWEWLYVT